MKNASLLSAKIASYGTLASALLGGKSVNAQIVYHNIKPDQDLFYNSSPLTLDLNGDGSADITFHMKTFMDSGYLVYNAMEASPEPGVSLVLKPSFYGVAALDPDTKIGKNLHAPYSWGISSRMAYQYSSEFGIMHTTAGAWNYKQGKNRYVGFRIQQGGRFYYGWIRCTVDFTLFELRKAELVVKDYAYNATPDQMIRAGQRTMENLSPEKNGPGTDSKNTVSVYAAGKTVHVLDSENEFTNGIITVYNLLGENIYDHRIDGKELSINLGDHPTGIYLVNLQNSQSRRAFKIALQ